MPAASSKPDNKGSYEPLDPMKNVITVIEKKVRNLEKRKGKLDTYREMQDGGDKLNKDQQEAVSKYDSVLLNLEFARELQKQFLIIQTEAEKLMKKQAKRERLAQQAQETKRVQEVLQLQNTLDSMGSEDVREHFLAGTSGAVKLTQEDLDHLDELYKLISPTRDGESSYQDQLTHASEHIVNFLDAKEKEVAGTTYKALKELVVKINECGYFEKTGESEEAKEEPETEPSPGTESSEEAGPITADGDAYRPSEVAAPVEQPEVTEERIHSNLLNHESVSTMEENTVLDPHSAHLVGHPVAPSGYSQEEESFFTTEAFPQPRPFQEIVSSVQGTFNFLQESQIMNEVAANDPAVIVATSTSLAHKESHLVQPVSYKSNTLLSNDPGLSTAPTQSSAVTSGMPTDAMGGAADHSGAAAVPGALVSQQPLDTYGSSGQDYFMAAQQPNTVSGLSFMSEQMGGLEQGLGAASEVPPAIPMPNQAAMSISGGEAAQEQMSEDKKPLFQMNPNAKMFRSMYSGPGQSGVGSNGGFSQSGAVGEDNFSQGQDYQGFGSNGYGQRSGRGRGGPRGGSGGRGGMSNGYSRGGRNGNPNGGYGGGRRDGGYSNGNSRGSGNRGNRGGPPRGQMRGRGGMSGGFGSGPRGNVSSQASA